MIAVELAFWSSAFIVVYTFAGYALVLLGVAAMRRTPSAGKDQAIGPELLPPVTVVVVAHNEAERIARKIDSILASDYPTERLRVLVASDASTDATNDIVRAYATRGVTLIDCQPRRGKAACLNQAITSVDTDIVVMTDARQRLAPDAVKSLVTTLLDERIGAVSGELKFEDDRPTDFSGGVDLYWRYEKLVRRLESIVDSTVGVTGALYALRRSLFQPLPEATVLDDLLVPMRVVKANRRVVFDSSAIAYDVPSRDPAQESRRKVRTLYGNWQLIAMEPWVLAPWRNRLWWQFMSHKILRLVAPAFLVVLLVCNAVLATESFFFRTLLFMHVAFYGAPLIGRLLPQIKLRSALMAPLAFVVLNWFAVRGFFQFLVKREAHLWR